MTLHYPWAAMWTRIGHDLLKVCNPDKTIDSMRLKFCVGYSKWVRYILYFNPYSRCTQAQLLHLKGLIRGPEQSQLHTPEQLLRVARPAGLLAEFNMLCVHKIAEYYAQSGLSQRLFINLMPQALIEGYADFCKASQFMKSCGFDLSQITIEITETQSILDRQLFRTRLQPLRDAGFRVALDDLGEGFSSLQLWSELRPDFVKVDMHLVQGVSESPVKRHFLRSLQQIAEGCESPLIAEGVETAADFCILRDLGIANAQGFFIGSGVKVPSPVVPQHVQALSESSRL